MSVAAFQTLVGRPEAAAMNSGLSPMKTAELLRIFGHPRKRKDYSAQCQSVTNTTLLRHMVTQSIGPFRVTGLNIAVQVFSEAFLDVHRALPELYDCLGSAGMLCCRLVRGSSSTLSNHSFGCALDITIGGQLDVRGDNRVQAGLLALYPYLHAHGLYWGAEYPTEDAMHWELAWETFLARWQGV